MCWRDDVPMSRVCIRCGQQYYGDLGHRGCPGWRKDEPASSPTESSRATSQEQPK